MVFSRKKNRTFFSLSFSIHSFLIFLPFFHHFLLCSRPRRNWFFTHGEKCQMKESIRKAQALVQQRFMNLLSSWRQRLFLLTNKCGESIKLFWIDPMKMLRQRKSAPLSLSLADGSCSLFLASNSITIFLFPFCLLRVSLFPGLSASNFSKRYRILDYITCRFTHSNISDLSWTEMGYAWRRSLTPVSIRYPNGGGS